MHFGVSQRMRYGALSDLRMNAWKDAFIDINTRDGRWNVANGVGLNEM